MFEKQIQFIADFDTVLNNEIQKTIEAFGFVVKDYVVNKQLFQKGVDGNGKKLRGYKRITIQLKKAKGQPTDRTTLRDDGSFHASIQINAYKDSFEITSNVVYDKYLLDPAESRNAYGFDAIKPSADNMKEFFENYLMPNLKKTIQEAFK